MVHVNEAVGVESYRLPGDLAWVMNVILVNSWGFASLGDVIVLAVYIVFREYRGKLCCCLDLTPNLVI